MPQPATQRWSVARLDEIPEVDDGRCRFRAVRHHLGISTFAVTAWTARAAGDRLINEHDESEPGSSEELYLVLRGRARFVLDGEELEADAGAFVNVQPGVQRTAFAIQEGTTILAVGGAAPGQAFEAVGWELWAPLGPLYQAGDYAAARARRSRTFAARSSCPRRSARSRRRTPTSSRSAATPPFRLC